MNKNSSIQSHVEVGEQVVYFSYAHGSYAEFTPVAEHQLFKVPEGVPLDVATSLLVQGLTAHYLTTSTYPLQNGQTVLVHAAAGGTGRLICQLARLRGARVIGTVGSRDKVRLASEVADHVITTEELAGRRRGGGTMREEGGDDVDAEGGGEAGPLTDAAVVAEYLAAAIRAVTGGDGVDVVYDGVGKATFALSVAALKPRGMLVLFGNASGLPPDIPVTSEDNCGWPSSVCQLFLLKKKNV
jgi:NADPH2:quinone reductase